MKQEVSIIMLKTNIKILTFILVSVCLTFHAKAGIVSLEHAKTHLRLNIETTKDFLSVDKKGDEIFLRTLNPEVFQHLSEQISSLSFDKKYISKISVENTDANNVSSIRLQLANPEVELFSFYRDRESKYVLDFWVEEDRPFSNNKISETQNRQEFQNVAPLAKTQMQGQETESEKTQQDEVSVKDAKVTPVAVLKDKNNSNKATQKRARNQANLNRDFRYGPPFVWDYAPLAPEPPSIINLSRKTAEYFYPIKNRPVEKSEEEAHLQLSINMYKDKKWGLMYKSIQLFDKKYPESKLGHMNEYLKANAILRENFEKGESRPVKMAISMYQKISEGADSYELRKALFKYLLSYRFRNEDYTQSLRLAKKYYVETQENYDYESSEYAVEMILASLGRLGQIDQIRELAKDKTLQKMVPNQLVTAYEIYSLLKLEKSQEVIDYYEQIKDGLVKPIHGSILFNVAEALFRVAEFEKAIKIFDEYTADFSEQTYSSHARLRVALSYDLLGRDFKKTLALYRSAINRSQDLAISYEARIRYVGMRSIRPTELEASDKEVRVFLNRDRRRQKVISKDLRHLLWITRLRTLIVDQDYRKALTYLNTVPLASLTPTKRRVFEGDGAEIVYGLILDMFKQAEYGNVVKTWEVYKDRYVDKVASDSYVNYLVGQSYIKLGLYEGFDSLYERFAGLEDTKPRTYPIWVERPNQQSSQELLIELQIVRNLELGNYQAASNLVEELSTLAPKLSKIHYYRGMIAYKKNDYDSSSTELEKYMTKQSKRIVYDPNEVAEMMLAYTDSLYQLNKTEHFKKVARALLNDTRGFAKNNKLMSEVREKISYLLIETYVSEGNDQGYALAMPMIEEFFKNYKDSSYQGRLSYLLGMAHVEFKNDKKGIEVFEGLLQDEEVSESIKELVRSELSLLRIKERTL